MPIDPMNLAATAKMTFKAVFVSLSLWNGTTGQLATDYWFDPIHGNGGTNSDSGEEEWYINSNYAATQSIKPWTIENKTLLLTLDIAPANIRPLIGGYKFTSGEINTFHDFSQTYGYFEMRAKVPAVDGMWSAFWLRRENSTWPPELDIMEILGRDPTTLHVNCHTRINARHGAGGGNLSETTPVTIPDASLAFHDYGVDWEEKTITWYFDRQAVARIPTPVDMHQPMYIQANLAGGGPWAKDIDMSKLPASLAIEYIKAYKEFPGGGQAKKDLGSGPDPVSGLLLVADNEPNQVLQGTPRSDTFIAGDNSVVMEGNGGRDRFVFNDIPINPGQITDFDPGLDWIDVSQLLAAAHYRGTQPFSDGLLSIAPTVDGGSELHFYPRRVKGFCCDYTIVKLDHVLPSQLNLAEDFIVK
ncbi:MAG TPA: family 16 glycosylhydrolase [Rhizomicrobium sp.]|nr:family 16 glycosylhydrolase [Rhizomicrobium sp.]